MGSYIQIDSISIDLASSFDKTSDAGKCEHFSIRGYVSEIRKRDWKLCWPFPVHESEEQPRLPPLDVPKFRCWHCQNCQQEIVAEGIDNDDQKDFNCCGTECRSVSNCRNKALNSGIMQDLRPDTLERREIDLNNSANPSCGNDCFPICNEKENKTGSVHSRITDLEVGLEDNPNHQVINVPLADVCPRHIQEVHTNETGNEGSEVSDVELATSNIKCMDRSFSDIYNGGKPISADSQCQKELRKACTTAGEGTIVMESGKITDDTNRHPSLESVACNHTVPAGITDNMVENDFQDHHPEKSTGSRRRPRKVRLMTDLLSENGEMKTDQTTTVQGSPSHGTSNASAALQTHPIFSGKVDDQGDLTLTNMDQSRKRRFLLDEERRPAGACLQRDENEDQNLEGDAKAIDTVLDSRPKDVLAGIGLRDAMKGYWSKPDIEQNHIMAKKNKKIHVVDNHSIPESHLGMERENVDAMDAADKAHASNTLSTGLTPCAFTGKGMDNFPSHNLRMEIEFHLSKGKGKMLQADGKMDSLSCRKNDMLVEGTFAYSGEKITSNMPVSIPIPSAQGAMNGKGLEEGLHLSLNSYLAAPFDNKKCIHQIENRQPFSFPLQGGTSVVCEVLRKDKETNVIGEPSIPSKHIKNASSGKGVRYEEFAGARNTEKTVEAVEQPSIMKRYSGQTVEVSEMGTIDDIPMEIVEYMAKNQYERCLPDKVHGSSLMEKSIIRRKAQMTAGTAVCGKGELSLLKEGQKEKPMGRHRKNGMVCRGEHVKPGKRNPTQYLYPFEGNHSGMSNPPQFPFGFEVPQSQKKPSSGFQFSTVGPSHLGSARNCKFNGSIAERESSNATFQGQGGCSLHKTILQRDDEASRIWASLNTNHVSLGYDVSKTVVSQPTSSNMDIISFRSGALHKQNMKRDIDLNYMNLNATDLEKLNRNAGPGTFNRFNAEYQFPCKHNGMEPHQNLRGSLDLYSNETIPAMHLLSLMDAGMPSRAPFNMGVNAQIRKPSYPSDCNTKLEIVTSKSHGAPKRPASSYLLEKSHGCFLGSPAFGASSSIQHENKFIRATDFNGQNSTKSGKKETMKSSNSTLLNRGSKQYSWHHLGTESPLQRKLEVRGTHETSVPLKMISGNSCNVNRNPADFAILETANAYMIRGEDLKFDKIILNRPRFPPLHGYKQQKNFKGTRMKKQAKH